MAYITPEQKRRILNETANCGSLKIGLERARVNYTDYLDLIEQEPTFKDKAKEAEGFFLENLNNVIGTMAKKRLYETLMNGVTQVTTSSEDIRDPEGNLVGSKQKVTKKYMGVPMAAIKEGIALIPPIDEAVQVLMANNALPQANLEKIQAAIVDYQTKMREAINGKTEDRQLTDQIIAAIQQAVIN